MPATDGSRTAALRMITEQIEEAVSAPKCHKCGCLQQTVEALGDTELGRDELAPLLTKARGVFAPKRYDCLGCAVCYPAIAANAFAEAYPDAGATLDLCPTEAPEERAGWPPMPGDFIVVRYGGPVAVCTLNSDALATELADRRPEGLAIVGTMRTENLGIERIIKNVVANPQIRFLVLCGEDTQQAIGHLPGQSLASLFVNGLDERGRIIGARGKRPVLKNVNAEEVAAFIQQVELMSVIGEQDVESLAAHVERLNRRNPGEYANPIRATPIERVLALDPKPLVLDKAGYFVVYPDARTHRLCVEHYTNQGLLNCVLEGTSTGALYGEAIDRGLVSRLDHAAYLGRELARAEHSLTSGTRFVQDAAPGRIAESDGQPSCSADASCSPVPAPTTSCCSARSEAEFADEQPKVDRCNRGGGASRDDCRLQGDSSTAGKRVQRASASAARR